ncbi:hypothetical protein MASR1M32_10230 [Rhodobacter sp.]
MIYLDASYSGGTLGSALAKDPEELAYALCALIDEGALENAREIADLAPYGRAGDIVTFLRELADKIEEADK